jgi:hypothetical protein
MKNVTVNVQIQFDVNSDTDEDIKNEVIHLLGSMSQTLAKYHMDNDPLIFTNSIDSSDFEVHTPEDERTEKIARIKEIIGEWGETSTAELEASSSPCISSTGNRPNVSVLVERFGEDKVGVFTYVDETETSEDELTYEELSDDVLDNILDLLEDYDTDNFKTQQRCQD